MLEHQSVWRAIDRLAARYNLSPSGLARQAGLDPTTFNKSKRITKEGKQRWPSTESLAKVLNATGASLSEFVSLVEDQESGAPQRRLPKLRFRSEEHTSELQSLMRISYAVFCLKKKTNYDTQRSQHYNN